MNQEFIKIDDYYILDMLIRNMQTAKNIASKRGFKELADQIQEAINPFAADRHLIKYGTEYQGDDYRI